MDLRGAKFEKANFQAADLSKAILRRANLKPHSFVGRAVRRTPTSRRRRRRASTSPRADLSLGNFRQGNFKRADFSGARGFDADLSGTLLIGANFKDAVLQEADLRFARAMGADFTGATLTGADLANADFSEAVFKKTKVWGATARETKPPKGKGAILSLSTVFSKAKEKKEKTADDKEKARKKRIAELEAGADKKPPHRTGRR